VGLEYVIVFINQTTKETLGMRWNGIRAGAAIGLGILAAAPGGFCGEGENPKAPAPSGLAKLELALPKPMFVGTPRDIRSPNLEQPRQGRRPDFFAPAGVKNVAAGKPVTSSDDRPVIGELEMVTDGVKEAGEGNYVALGPRLQHVQIDLGAPHEIFAVVIWFYHGNARVFRDVVVQTADDPDLIMNVRTLFNNDHDNSSGLGIGKDYEYVATYEGKIVDGKGAKGRYVRICSNGNTTDGLNQYCEVEVYGRPAK
jgi:hypothetical protein